MGDGYAEKRHGSTRFCFQQEGSHSAYIFWLHNLVATLGYCNVAIPKINTRLGKNGIIRLIFRFKTFSFVSFNWIHDVFYVNGIKVVPLLLRNIYHHLP
jgi:hypothetical protein